jgi:hypothetical protein
MAVLFYRHLNRHPGGIHLTKAETEKEKEKEKETDRFKLRPLRFSFLATDTIQTRREEAIQGKRQTDGQ